MSEKFIEYLRNNGLAENTCNSYNKDVELFKKYYEDSYGGGRHGSHNRGGSVYITKIHKGSPYPYHISTGKRLGSGDLGWLKLSQISGYATGVKNLPNSELAWTQEGNKEEYIIRKSDGAILTPIAKKGSVLNHEASGNIWNMANNPSDFIRDNLFLIN